MVRRILFGAVLALLGLEVSAHADPLRASGVQLSPRASSNIPVFSAGLWNSSADGLPRWRKADGTDVLMTGGVSTLPTDYANGGPGPQTLSLDSTRLGVLIRDNVTPLPSGTTLFGVQSSTGTKYLDITASAPAGSTGWTFTTNVADGPGSVGLSIINTTLLSAGRPLVRIGEGAAIILEVDPAGKLWGTGGAAGNGSFITLNGSGVTVGYSSDGIWLGIDNAILGFNFVVSSANVWFMDNAALYPSVDLTGESIGKSNARPSAVWSKQFNGVVQMVAFSATPSVNCTNGETVQIGNISANITGATMAASGNPGEVCTVIFQKDPTVTPVNVTWTGTNVRTAGTLALPGVANTVATQTFRWDSQLGTAAWVEIGRATGL